MLGVNKLHSVTSVTREVRQNELMLPPGPERSARLRKQSGVLQHVGCSHPTSAQPPLPQRTHGRMWGSCWELGAAWRLCVLVSVQWVINLALPAVGPPSPELLSSRALGEIHNNCKPCRQTPCFH